ncbi:MAG: hypothetical protein M3R63_01905 [Actinomycetota bacterium]|nr:hypothetical protein [Actinomycetota bacterium]
MEQSDDQQDAAIASFAFELNVLKRMRRAGWWHVGVRDPVAPAPRPLTVSRDERAQPRQRLRATS